MRSPGHRSPPPSQPPPANPAFEAERDSVRIRRHLRDLVEDSDLPHAGIERRGGMSRGYLSQILHDRIELKLWHVLAVLRGLGVDPARFFAAAYPRRRRAAERDAAGRFPVLGDPGVDLALARERLALLVFGISEVEALRQRAARCEAALWEVSRSPDVARRLQADC